MPYIIGTLLSPASIVGKTLPLPNNDVDSAAQKTHAIINRQSVIGNKHQRHLLAML